MPMRHLLQGEPCNPYLLQGLQQQQQQQQQQPSRSNFPPALGGSSSRRHSSSSSVESRLQLRKRQSSWRPCMKQLMQLKRQ
jgi:hypothetical protein